MSREITIRNHARAILALPVTNTVIIPSILIAVFRDARLLGGAWQQELAAAAIALPMLAAGIGLVVRAIALFVRRGRGTLAPWDPTEVLLTEGVYRFSRNPMKAGLFLVLIGEAVLLRSTALSLWAAVFIGVNVLYIPWSEEPGLRARFGAEYMSYCRRVPRWFRWPSGRDATSPQAERLS